MILKMKKMLCLKNNIDFIFIFNVIQEIKVGEPKPEYIINKHPGLSNQDLFFKHSGKPSALVQAVNKFCASFSLCSVTSYSIMIIMREMSESY